MILNNYASEPGVVYKSAKCQICAEKDRTIHILEELNDLLKDKIISLQTKTA